MSFTLSITKYFPLYSNPISKQSTEIILNIFIHFGHKNLKRKKLCRFVQNLVDNE